MFTKSKTKKPCRASPIVIESKLKPLPNIGNASKLASSARHSHRDPNTTSKPRNRSSERKTRSGSITERDTGPGRTGKVLNSLSKRSRGCVQCVSFGRGSDTNIASSDAAATHTFYTGRSSDPSFEDPACRSQLPDPYADLRSNLDGSVPLDPSAPWWLFLAEMKLQARRQAVILDSKPDPHPTPRPEEPADPLQGGKARPPDSRADNRPDDERLSGRQERPEKDDGRNPSEREESSANHCSDRKARDIHSEDDSKGQEDATGHEDNSNDEDEDEDEDETGLPPAVRALQPKPAVSLNAREVVRERHSAMMEEVARTVSQHHLLSHLRTQGFFNYDYSQHARTNMTNHNLRRGRKKGMERLLLLLACRPAKCTGELFGAV